MKHIPLSRGFLIKCQTLCGWQYSITRVLAPRRLWLALSLVILSPRAFGLGLYLNACFRILVNSSGYNWRTTKGKHLTSSMSSGRYIYSLLQARYQKGCRGMGKKCWQYTRFGFFFSQRRGREFVTVCAVLWSATVKKLLVTRYSSTRLAELREEMLCFMIWNKMCSFPVF